MKLVLRAAAPAEPSVLRDLPLDLLIFSSSVFSLPQASNVSPSWAGWLTFG